MWAAATLVVAAAFWIELAPDPSVAHPFATVEIRPGEVVSHQNTEQRDVPAGLFEPVELGAVVTRIVAPGEPVLVGAISEGREGLVPRDWWIVAIPLPPFADVGDGVQVVLIETGTSVAGVVAALASDDPFSSGTGAVAVPPSSAAEVAIMAAEGRVAVLVGTG